MSTPIYEGDIILLSILKANGYLSAVSNSSSYSYVTVQPYTRNGHPNIPNVHFLAFKILPEYAYRSHDAVSSPVIYAKTLYALSVDLASSTELCNHHCRTANCLAHLHEANENCLHREIVYGRRIKLLHLASCQYLSLPPFDIDSDSKPAILSKCVDYTCFFKLLPQAKFLGDVVCHNDDVILESVKQKGYHVLCVNNSLTQSFELKAAITNSVFNIHLHSSAHIDVPPNAIRAGYVIRLHNMTINAYICGQGSTVDNIVPDEVKQHSFPTRVGARKKKNTLLPRPRPVSGDSFWQIEKSDSPINGETPFVYGEKCRLKHLLTKKYLAVIEKNQIILADNDRRDCDYDFILTSTTYNIDRIVELGDTIKLQYIYTIEAETHIKYVSINENNWEWMKESAKENLSGSKWFYLSLKDDSTVLNSFTADSVKPNILHQFYFLEGVKDVLIKYMLLMNKKIVNLVYDELYEVLNDLCVKLQDITNKKIYSKMLRTTHSIDLLMGFIAIEANKESCVLTCNVLKWFSDVDRYSNDTCIYLDMLYKKIGKGLGVESVLFSLSDYNRSVGDYMIKCINSMSDTLKASLYCKRDKFILDLLSKHCSFNGYYYHYIQNLVYDAILKEDLGIFYHMELKNDDIYCFINTPSANRLLLQELNKTEVEFFISQLKFFSSLCKGINKFIIEAVSKWFPFNEVLLVLKSPKVHPLIKAAFYEFVLSVYIDNSIEASGVDVDSLWKCYLWEKLFTINQPLKGANVRKSMIKDLEYSIEIAEIIEIIISQMKKSVLYIDNDDENELISQMLAVLESMIYFGYCWNIDNDDHDHDDDDVSLEGLFISMLDPSTDVMNCQDNTTVKSYSKLGIFSIKLKIIKLLQILFKQYIYLAVEQLLFDFCNVKDNTIRSFPTDMFNPPSILCTKDISSQMNSLQLSALYKNIDKYFKFKHYQIFDPRHNQKLTDILLSLIRNEHFNIQSNCAKLLYEINNRENIMLDYAKSAYIVLNEKSLYEKMILYGSFHHGYNHLKLLIQGSGNQEVCDVLDQLISLMIVGEDETEIKACVQNIMSTTGIFSSVMKYILKFCPCPVLDETQTKVFNSLCVLLQIMCRRNEKIQGEIFVHFSDLLKVTRYTASPIANLLTEVLSNNVALCEELCKSSLRDIYELASTNSDSVGFLEFMVTLEAVINPFKSTSVISINQEIIAQVFFETHQDIFEELMTKDNANQRIKILKERTDESVDLMKLIYLTNLLATCCKGHNMFCENICQDIFTLEELVEILTDPQIPIKYKTPFAQILLECYLSTERESIVSLHKLSTNIMFWNHVTTCVQYLISIPETIADEDKRMKIKYFLKKVFEMHMSQTSTYNVDEALKPVCYVLHYFTRGIGPLLTSLCVQLKLYKFKKLTMVEYQRITDPLCPTLNELANAIVNLLSSQNEEMFLTNKAQANFWFNILTSINNIIPHSVSHQIDFDNGNFFLSKELIKYNYSVQSEVKLNEQFQCFISNYKSINSYNLFDSPRIKDFVELLPDGYKLMRLAGFIPEEHRQHVQSQHAKDFDPKSLIILIEVLFDKIHVNSSKLKATYRQILTSCFKILIGDFCMIIQKIDSSKDWEMEYEKKIKPMQAALMDSKLPQIVLRHINYPDDDITVHLLAFFMTLFWHGNEDTQTKFHDIIEENDSFFIRIHKLITVAISCFKHSVKYIIKNEDKDKPQALNYQEMIITSSYSCDLVTLVDIEDNLDCRKLMNLTSFHEEKSFVIIQDDAVISTAFSGIKQHQQTCTLPDNALVVRDELEKTKDIILQGASFVMRLLSAMCDGQHRAMQNTLRYQKQCKTRYNIVCDVASLMQFLVEVPVLSNIPVINDAIQALIEMCAGNFDNQHIALNGQVIGSINIILKNPLESVEGIRMQCKAIELLEVLLEETDVKYSEIFEAISKDLQISCVTCFIRNAYKNSSIDSNKKIDNTCIVTRNIFRAYHILLNLASKVKASFGEFVGLDDWDNIQEEPWRYLKKNTYSIEVNYVTKDDKEILTKVYFPFSHQREMTKQEQYKLQSEINRDDPEDKVKDLLEWTQSVWKNDKHKRKLERYAAIKGLLFGLYVRDILLIILTIVVNILALIFFRVPDCDNSTMANSTLLIVIPRHFECWEFYEYIILYLLGVPHFVLSLWMTIEYFVTELPNFVFMTPNNHNMLYDVTSNFSFLHRCFPSDPPPRRSLCFDIYFLSYKPVGYIIFVTCSGLSLLTYGYFYSFCLILILARFNVIQQVIEAVAGKVWQIVFVVLLMMSIMFAYAVLSYTFLSTFFNAQSNLFCSTLWQCFITVMREGILDTFGNRIPVTAVNQIHPDFGIYVWRAIIDLSFYVVINIIGLNIITAILVDRFSELRAKKDAAYNDQKSVCFICGIPNDTFEKEGVKGKGFRDHYKNDHNVYSYIYYVLYIKSKSTQDHNAIEKYVYDMVNKKSVKFYPLHKAKALGY